MPTRSRGFLWRAKLAAGLRKASQKVQTRMGKTKIGKAIGVSLRKGASVVKRTSFGSQKADLAIDLLKLEIYEDAVIEFLDWLKALKKKQKLMRFTSFQRFLKSRNFSGEKNRIIFVIPLLSEFEANLIFF